jgi:hypothetical protein
LQYLNFPHAFFRDFSSLFALDPPKSVVLCRLRPFDGLILSPKIPTTCLNRILESSCNRDSKTQIVPKQRDTREGKKNDKVDEKKVDEKNEKEDEKVE